MLRACSSAWISLLRQVGAFDFRSDSALESTARGKNGAGPYCTSGQLQLRIQERSMSSEPLRDPVADHLLTPKNAAFLLIDYQPVQVNSIASMERQRLV